MTREPKFKKLWRLRLKPAAKLLRAAELGYFPEPGTLRRKDLVPDLFQPRPYRIRLARQKDLKVLIDLEAACWREEIRTPPDQLERRLGHRHGQLVLEVNDQIQAVIWSQRIDDLDQLQGMDQVLAETLHSEGSPVVQLLAVNVWPQSQHAAYGDQLLEFMLQYCSLQDEVREVAAVTLFRKYHHQTELSPQAYLEARDEFGLPLDPILRFHHLHGATILKLMADYRPQDIHNRGNGVLIHYNMLDRLPRQITAPPPLLNSPNAQSAPKVMDHLRQLIQQILGQEGTAFAEDQPFLEMGLDSMDLQDLRLSLEQALSTTLETTLFFECPTARALARRISATETQTSHEPEPPRLQSVDGSKRIAVTGIACRFPGGSNDPESFWELLRSGRDAVGQLPANRWRFDASRHPEVLRHGAFLDDIRHFDAAFFRISPREAELMDPQQRLLLELSWNALEDAALSADDLAGSATGVYIGCCHYDYRERLQSLPQANDAYFATGTAPNMLANRISYFLDLHGPSMHLDTACSSSLVAVHEAVKALRSGEVQRAIAGGVNLICSPTTSSTYNAAGMLAPDGRCKSFDAAANGYVRGEGVAVVVLEPLQQAEANGQPIRALILGSAVNHGGMAGSLTAPQPSAQAALIKAALADADIQASSLSYVEAHGTGTPLGDPVEVKGLNLALGVKAGIPPCYLGSLKTQVGHLEGAAGIAGMIKVILALTHKQIPANLHFQRLNPLIDLAGRFVIAKQLTPWPDRSEPRRSSVSSFGFGGANALVILEEAPPAPPSKPAEGPWLFVLSALEPPALKRRIKMLASWLMQHKPDLADVARTLQLGRRHFPQRWAAIAADHAELLAALADDTQTHTSTAAPTELIPLASAFRLGEQVDFRALWTQTGPRVALPTYPFAGAAHWLPEDDQKVDTSIMLKADHFLLDQHRIRGEAVLPGSAGLGFVLSQAKASGSQRMTEICWERPIKVQDQQDLLIVLAPDQNGNRFELHTQNQRCCSGHLAHGAESIMPELDLEAVRSRCTQHLDQSAIYPRFSNLGLDYGPVFQSLTDLWLGHDEALAKIQIRDTGEEVDFALRLDAAFQACVLFDSHRFEGLALPFQLRGLHFTTLARACYVYIRSRGPERSLGYEGLLTDSSGRGVGQLDHFVLHALRTQTKQLHWLRPEWRDWTPPNAKRSGRLLLLDRDNTLEHLLAAQDPQADVVRLAELSPGNEPNLLQSLRPSAILIHASDTDENPVLNLVRLLRGIKTARLGQTLPLLFLHGPRVEDQAVAGFAAAWQREEPQLPLSTLAYTSLLAELVAPLSLSTRLELRHDGSHFQRRHWASFNPPASPCSPLRNGGHYLITGGRGGLGQVFAQYLVDSYRARVSLIGRSAAVADNDTHRLHLSADLGDADQTLHAISAARNHFGPIHGVIHAAGVLRDGLLIRKPGEDFAAVLAPKLAGARNLQAALVAEQPDFILLCSSFVAILGNQAQTDYAYANRALDALAEHLGAPWRSLAWPLWETAGMGGGNGDLAQAMERSFGLLPISNATGTTLLETALSCNEPWLWPCYGDLNRVKTLLEPSPSPEIAPEQHNTQARLEHTEALESFACTWLTQRFAEHSKQRPEQLRLNEPLETYGLDSFLVTSFTRLLEDDFGPLSATLLYEHQTLASLAAHLTSNHAKTLQALRGQTPELAPSGPSPLLRQPDQATTQKRPDASNQIPASNQRDIAIIGVAGRYPQAPDLASFWRNLAEGRDCIEEIPSERWDWRSYYHPERQKGKTINKWGGFIADIECFDPLFFQISPREVPSLDPQERLFMQTTWHALEDACHSKSELRGAQVGVYVGVMYSQYQLFGAEDSLRGNPGSTTSWYASIANRVSHFFDWHGPSLALDTMCSSSLTAVHLACRDLRDGTISHAVAGGINLSLHPDKDLRLSAGGFSASDGRCKSFGAWGDGYVPGEGVGAVLLKRLDHALEAGDAIHAIIEGSALNHGGKTNGYTVPNPVAQGDLISAALRDARIQPSQLSYLEAHGTGTSLGDPIEIAGLKRAFQSLEPNLPPQFCALGSAKSNIGHLEAAAGIAGLTKIILQLQHQQLAPSLHCQPSNPKIDFASSPFRLQHDLQPWPSSVNALGEAQPRRAGISSFGAGGANAHLIVREAPEQSASKSAAPNQRLFPLSAASPEALARLIDALKVHLHDQPEIDLNDLAFSLQQGRDHLSERLIIAASQRDQLQKALNAFPNMTAYSWRGSGHGRNLQRPQDDLMGMAEAWASGEELPWHRIFPRNGARKLHLPLYPFDRQVFPLPKGQQPLKPALHPLLDENCSSFERYRFAKTLHRSDPLLADHIISRQAILPAAAILEMARAAAVAMTGHEVLGLFKLTWTRPVIVHDDPVTIHLNLERGERELSFTLSLANGGQICARGHIGLGTSQPSAERLDLNHRDVGANGLDEAAALYQRFTRADMSYGPSFQTIQTLECSLNEASAHLVFSGPVQDKVQLLPQILDGALQVCVSLLPDQGVPWIPASLDVLHLYGSLGNEAWAVIRLQEQGTRRARFQVRIADQNGRLIACLEGLTLMIPQVKVSPRVEPSLPADILFQPCWTALTENVELTTTPAATAILVTPSFKHEAESLCLLLPGPARLYTPSELEAEAKSPLDTLVFLCLSSRPQNCSAADLAEAQEQGVLTLFRCLRHLFQSGRWHMLARVIVVSNGAFATSAEQTTNPNGAALFGLMTSLAHEFPNLDARCVDLPAEPAAQDWQHLVAYLSHKGCDLVALRAGQTLRRTLVPAMLDPHQSILLREEAVVLILGGAGGIGLETAVLLARLCAARVALVGRSPLAPQLRRDLDRIVAAGGQWSYYQADGTDLEQMRAVVAQVEQLWGAPNAIVHSAIVLADRKLAAMAETHFRQALWPKLMGCAVLAEVTAHLSLDFALFHSSFQSFWGNPGQSNYAAGCTFKDAFAHYLGETRGCISKVINWGYWDEVGIVRGDHYRDQLARAGIFPLSVSEGVAVMEQLLKGGPTQVSAIRASASVLERAGFAGDTAPIARLVQALRRSSTAHSQSPEILKQREGLVALDAWASARLVQCLRPSGLFRNEFDFNQAAELLQLVPKYRRLLAALLKILCDCGALRESQGIYHPTAELNEYKSTESFQPFRARYPELGAHLELLEPCLEALLAILAGQTSATDVVFPAGQLTRVEGVYRGTPVSDHFQRLSAETVASWLRERISSAPFCVLEIGAGTGGTSAFALEALRDLPVTYYYTDVSASFTKHGRKHFGHYPFVRFEVLDIERDVSQQGFEAHSVDLVLAANVIHATRDLAKTLEQVRFLLKPGGALVLNEVVCFQVFTSLTFGLLEGWWLFEDHQRRIAHTPLLSPALWHQLLRDQGFESSHALAEGAQESMAGQAVILAQGPSSIPQAKTLQASVETWLRALLARAIGVTPEAIVAEEPWDHDLVELTRALRSEWGEDAPPLSPQLLVDYPNLTQLTQYFSSHHAAMLGQRFGLAAASTAPLAAVQSIQAQPKSEAKPVKQTQTLASLNELYAIEQWLRQLFGRVLEMPAARFETSSDWDQYGIDSLLNGEIQGELERSCPGLPLTLLYECSNLKQLTQYFAASHLERMRTVLGLAPATPAPAIPRPATVSTSEKPAQINDSEPLDDAAPLKPLEHKIEPIAVIGMHGRFPGAANLKEFWNNLRDGVCSTREIPAQRWDWHNHFKPGRDSGGCYSRWGAFLDDVDAFDALFFNILPREAELMDPQERLFLESAWSAMEDAGYSRSELAQLGTVGVFAGVMNSGYARLAGQLLDQGEELAGLPVTAHWSIANRVSYTLDLHGPSMAVDTACAGGLTALHLAIESLRRKETRMAFAGAVNLILHPSQYHKLSTMQMLSEGAQCKPFGASSDGFVDGEGVAVVLLKPLAAALADDDAIHSILLECAANHDGKTSGMTVPNPKAQTQLIHKVLKAAQVDLASISYVEAHGTGTEVGDPLEISALNKAFEGRQTPCPVGSIKGNIGHGEAVSGMAGLFKLVLMMQHRQLVPSLHCQELNPKINFGAGPFLPQRQLADWQAQRPRIAAINCFGAGGSNTHALVQEAPSRSKGLNIERSAWLIPVSARNPTVLTARLKELNVWLEAEAGLMPLAAISYTLAQGRDHFQARCAFIVNSKQHLQKLLKRHLRGKPSPEVWIAPPEPCEQTPMLRQMALVLLDDLQQDLKPEDYQEKLAALADLYVRGLSLDWTRLFGATRPQRIHMPTYPFEQTRYWLAIERQPQKDPAVLHPLLDQNRSSLSALRFSKRFTPEDRIVADHRFEGRPTLPAAALLEMAKAAASFCADGMPVSGLSNIQWHLPLIVDQPLTTELNLSPAQAGAQVNLSPCELSFELGESERVFAQGVVHLGASDPALNHRLKQRRSEASHILEVKAAYERLAQTGLSYGASYRNLDQLVVGHDFVLAQVRMNGEPRQHDLEAWDSAFQTVAAFMDQQVQKVPLLPARLGRLNWYQKLPAQFEVLAEITQQTVGQISCNFQLIGPDDALLAEALDFHFAAAKPLPQDEHTICYQPQWHALPQLALPALRHLFVLDSSDERVAQLRILLGQDARVIQVAMGARFKKFSDDHFEIDPGKLADFQALCGALPKGELCVLQLWNLESNWAPARHDQDLLHSVGTAQHLIGALRSKGHSHARIVSAAHHPLGGLMHGFARSLGHEQPGYSWTHIQVGRLETRALLARLLAEFSSNLPVCELRYEGEQRLARSWVPCPARNATPRLRPSGVYLISGGAGGVGSHLARHLAERYQARLVLCGSSEPGPLSAQHCAELNRLGADALYLQTDVTHGPALVDTVAAVLEKFGQLHGVFHCAGRLGDALIGQKPWSESQALIKVKTGIINLDQATRDLPLDFMMGFSSIAAVFGNQGQSDYASGSAFLNQFALWRSDQVLQGTRSGLSLAIAWPHWEQGGMLLKPSQKAWISENLGLRSLTTAEALRALEFALSQNQAEVVVMAGDPVKFHKQLEYSPMQAPIPPVAMAADLPQSRALMDDTLARVFTQVLKLPRNELQANRNFEEYGIDSLTRTDLVHALERQFGALPKTLLFEMTTFAQLVTWFMEHHPIAVSQPQPNPPSAAASVPVQGQPLAVKPLVPKPEPVPLTTTLPPSPLADIAVIGLAGTYPMARDIDQFWNLLQSGQDCVAEIPGTRWSTENFYRGAEAEPGWSVSKWGTFIEDFDRFDPLFFQISQSEALTMDPQERLFLQVAWATLEDAGYDRAGFAASTQARVGVYVGAMWNEYQLHSGFGPQQNWVSLGGSFAAIANRVSYTLGFQGPSLTVDSMCSSALTGLHLACQSLRSGESSAALVGGVNLNLHPNKYIHASQLQLLSSEGRCRSFGENASGYVPGEGIGAALLRPLNSAIAAADPIYGVIKISNANHGGKSGGYLMPNPGAQTRLLSEALQRSEIHPETIGYVEASATGSSMGDSIEVLALAKAFQPYTQRTGFCALGSLKTSFGHMEAASGIAALTKVLLQLKHQVLVPTVHIGKVNTNLRFSETSFRLQTHLQDWPAPSYEGRAYPRRALLNAFGAGGSNVTVLLEEYKAPQAAKRPMQPELIVLSAHNEASLMQQAARLAHFLTERPEAVHISDLAYTLQIGREAMEERLAFVAASLDGLSARLAQIAHGEHHSAYRGSTENRANRLILDEIGPEVIAVVLASRDLDKIARLWVCGLNIDWLALHEQPRPQRISLPTYPFAGGRYWPNRKPSNALIPQAPAVSSRPDPHKEDRTPLTEQIAKILGMAAAQLDPERNLLHYGFSSIFALRLARRLEPTYGALPLHIFAKYQSVRQLADYLDSLPRPMRVTLEPQHLGNEPGLSSSQQALWSRFFHAPHDTAYNVPFGLVLPKHWSLVQLQQRLMSCFHNYPDLSRRFQLNSRGEVERGNSSEMPPVIELDLSQLSEEQLKTELWALARKRFDLLAERPCRLYHIRQAQGHNLLLVVFHHIVFDGFSAALFLQQLQADNEVTLHAPQFGEFVAWERHYLASANAKADRSYWLEQFASTAPSVLFPRDNAQGWQPGQLWETRLSRSATELLRGHGIEQNQSLNAVMMAAFARLLAQTQGRDEIVFGIPVDIRPNERFDQAIGFYVNMLPMQVQGARTLAAASLAQNLAQQIEHGIGHRFLPFPTWVGALKNKSPLFDTAFYFQSWSLNLDTQALLPWLGQSGEYALVLEVVEDVSGCRLIWKFDPACVKLQQVQALAQTYQQLLEAEHPQTSSPQASVGWPRPDYNYPRQLCVQDLIQQQVEQRPEAVAVIFEDMRWSYEQLWARAGAIAQALTDQKIGPGSLVGLLLERSADMLAGLLGILRAGAAYVPLDPNYPSSRILYILRDAGIGMLVTDSTQKHSFEGVEALLIDQLDSSPSAAMQPTVADPEAPAYVIYTSGSTGNPKGVQVGHRALTHFLCSMAEEPGFGADDQLLALTTVCFDISALELYLPLICGGRVEIASSALARNGVKLARHIENCGATVVQATPATWDMVLAAGLAPVPGLRILCGGEAWSEQLARRLLQRADQVWNMFGPTETTIWSSVYRVGNDGRVCLGNPIGNTSFWVLDENGESVQPGECGELYIGGDGVAQGYLGKPELTRERFVAHPKDKNLRLYKTGDLVRLTPA